MTFLLISPNFEEIQSAEGDDLEDAIASFKSSVWRQGAGADERVMEAFGDWLVYTKPIDPLAPLYYKGRMRDC